MLGNNTPKNPTKFLSLSNGKVIEKKSKDEKIEHAYVSGMLESVELRQTTINGEVAKYFDFHISDGDERYTLSTGESQSVTRSIIKSLANAPSLDKPIVISPWPKVDAATGKSYTNVTIYLGTDKATQVKLGWDPNLKEPPVENVNLGDKIAKNDYNRRMFILTLVDSINAKIGFQRPEDEPTDDEIDDLPPGLSD